MFLNTLFQLYGKEINMDMEFLNKKYVGLEGKWWLLIIVLVVLVVLAYYMGWLSFLGI